MKGDRTMIIMASTLIKAINECRHIRPEELIREQIENLDNKTEQIERKEGKKNV